MTTYKHRWAGTIEHTLRRLCASALQGQKLPDTIRYDLYSEPVDRAEVYYIIAKAPTQRGEACIEFTLTVREGSVVIEDGPQGVSYVDVNAPEPVIADVSVTLAGREVYSSWDPDTGNWHATGPVPARQSMPAAYAVGEVWARKGLTPGDYATSTGTTARAVASALNPASALTAPSAPARPASAATAAPGTEAAKAPGPLTATQLSAMLAFAGYALAAIPQSTVLPEAAITINALEP